MAENETIGTIASELVSIATEHGYEGPQDLTIAGAIDALADTLAGEDVDSGRTIAEAVRALAPYVGGGAPEYTRVCNFQFDSSVTGNPTVFLYLDKPETGDGNSMPGQICRLLTFSGGSAIGVGVYVLLPTIGKNQSVKLADMMGNTYEFDTYPVSGTTRPIGFFMPDTGNVPLQLSFV